MAETEKNNPAGKDGSGAADKAAKSKEKEKKSSKAAKAKNKGGLSRRLREMRSELKKITWPDRKTVLKNTGTVLLCSLIIGMCIWIFDAVTVNAVQMLISVFAS